MDGCGGRGTLTCGIGVFAESSLGGESLSESASEVLGLTAEAGGGGGTAMGAMGIFADCSSGGESLSESESSNDSSEELDTTDESSSSELSTSCLSSDASSLSLVYPRPRSIACGLLTVAAPVLLDSTLALLIARLS